MSLALLAADTVAAIGQSAPPPHDARAKNGPPLRDANHEGVVFTCEEWKIFANQIFSSADRNHDGKLDRSEFAVAQKAGGAFVDADFGYFDDNQDGRISRSEFLTKPNTFIVRFDRNGDCRVTTDEIDETVQHENGPGRPDGRPRDGIH